MKIESKREKWLPFGWYSALFFVFFGVGILFHVINGRSFIYNVDAPGQDYPTFLYFGKLLRRFLSTGSVRLYDFSIGLGSDVISPLNFNGFGDPLNLLSVFAVGKGAVRLYEFTLILRLWLCGAASAGAINYTPVAKVTNLSNTIKELKKKGMWFVCADMDGTVMYDLDLRGAIGLVIGSEGEGVSKLVKEHCDFTAAIPMAGNIDSLNASVAAGVLAYEVVRQNL